MELMEKMAILTDAAKYDVSCSSSGSSRRNQGGLGNGHASGICHSWSEDGRCISLLKILYTNHCIYNCRYCVNAKDHDGPRACFTPEEVVDLTINFYRRNYIEGLFLSSGIIKSPDYTMEQLIKIAEKLRHEENFNGYIHMKAIPGSSWELIHRLGEAVDRLSVNIELPTKRALALLAPEKDQNKILPTMEDLSYHIKERKIKGRKDKSLAKFVPAGQTTQMIVGASQEDDLTILSKAQDLYDRYRMKRVYYSAYIPVGQSPLLERVKEAPLLREHRIYQGDFLMRFYGFRSQDILDATNPYFDIHVDPKMNWAINHYEGPIEINRATYRELLRIPGIGPTSAQKIIKARGFSSLRYEDLKKLRISTKRALHFITVGGEYRGLSFDSRESLRYAVTEGFKRKGQQLTIWEMVT